MAFSSDEVNYLVYRYLKESGFQHSAFTFGCESSIAQNPDINPADVQIGSLINIIQKGLLYEELESQLKQDGAFEPPTLVKSLNKSTKQTTKKRGERDAPGKNTSAASTHTSSTPSRTAVLPAGSIIDERNIDVKKDNTLILEGHTAEVSICAWNPKMPLLATGSGDGTARIWRIAPGSVSAKTTKELALNPVTLKHSQGAKEKGKDVTTLDWNPAGSLLATGSFDGSARIWDTKGNLKFKLQKHTGAIFSLRWSRNGEYLLSGSVDKSTIIWEALNGQVKQQFEFHSAATLDVDWRNSTSFASCSSDKLIHVCELGKTKPLITFEGHQDEVNAVRWDPQGLLLASCSDDQTAKVWKMDQTTPAWNLTDHEKEIYTLRWSPTGPTSKNPNKPLLLATASFDTTVKLWDVAVGKCVHTLAKHTDAVYSVAFSPDGDYVATGSFDKCLHIWSVKDGAVVKTYRGTGGIFEVSWNSGGERVAASFSDNSVAVVDFRM